MEKTFSLSEAKTKLNRLAEDVATKDDEIIITKNGAPIAVLVSPQIYDGWKETLEIMSNKPFYADIKRGIKNLKKGKKRIPVAEIFKED